MNRDERLAVMAGATSYSGWLRRYAPSGACKRCGGPLPADRRFTHIECDQAAAAAERQVALERLTSPGSDVLQDLVPPALFARKLPFCDPGFPAEDRWSAETQQALTAWRPQGSGVWIVGTVGSGKTTLLAGLVLELRQRGVPAFMTSASYLLSGLRGMQREQPSRYVQALDALAEVPVLVLDDLFVEAPTEWERGVLYELLDARMGSGAPLLASGNRPIHQLETVIRREGAGEEEATMARRIASRLSACTGNRTLRCMYPGDRRTGSYDRQLEARLLPLLGSAGGAR